jgi:hypothetical protein
MTEPDNQTVPLLPDGTKCIKESTGRLLYHVHMVDPTMLVALRTITALQSKGAEAMADAIVQLLEYHATHLESTI